MAVKPVDFYKYLAKYGVDFFTGVPDSLLKEFCFFVDDNVIKERHVITANEGNAIALATGYYFSTGKLPLVYMQNSGLGNAVNPLLSLCDQNVYSVPMLLLIGWRGEPGIKDEPQHTKQGEILLDLLNVMDIPYEIISRTELDIEKKVAKSIGKAVKENQPVAIIVKKGTFEKYKFSSPTIDESLMSREESLEIILENLPSDSIIVSTTGKTSREIFEIRENKRLSHHQDFLTVGSMGHCSSIALGIAISQSDERSIVCIDGDGALIMHMGSLATVGKLKPDNFYHILINNHIHESVGGQKTAVEFVDINKLIKSNGYKFVYSVKNASKLKSVIKDFLQKEGPVFLEIIVKPGTRDDLGRPTIKPKDNKESFMDFLKK